MIREKAKVLVRDNKGLFFKMFKKELINEFNLIENPLLTENQTELKDLNRFIFVVYNTLELADFLKQEKKGCVFLVCLFNKRLRGNSSFMEEINDLIMLDSYKTKRTIVKDLKSHLKNNASGFKNDVLNLYKSQALFHGFFKTVFLFV
ncbi:hypothetical protein [Flavobacterium chilense]|uniref:Uncharacterized protein n=1 Tax=Flavobacterium chilense TaxID=946677 RepID=A0A1M6ZLG5_9FLAO|nr:hypothetical protein [Flavobacterium chilense]SHL31296.1 hypothetical protein SAMN05444484_1011073 [Flavobacterium chilense]